MKHASVSWEDRQGILWIRMDDGKVNAINPSLLEGLEAAFDAAEGWGNKAVVLAGKPGCFSAGLDLRQLPALPMDELRSTLQLFGSVAQRIAGFRRPVIGALTGHAIAGGAVLALCTDLRIGAAGDYKIGLNEVAIGITLPPFVVDLAAHVLEKRAQTAAIVHGRLYAPDGALAVGYLDRVVEADELEAAVQAVATELAELPNPAYADTKARLRRELLSAAKEDMAEHLAIFVANARPR